MTSLTIIPGRPLKGTITVPGDKSLTHRAIILTALAEGTSTISGYCPGEDCLNTMRAFQGLGIPITQTATELTVHGKGFWGLTEPSAPDRLRQLGNRYSSAHGSIVRTRFFLSSHRRRIDQTASYGAGRQATARDGRGYWRP